MEYNYCCECSYFPKFPARYGTTGLITVFKTFRPPLWSSSQSSCLQIQKSEFDSQLYQIFREVVGLERGPLSLVSTIEELLGRKNSGSSLESRQYGRGDLLRLPHGTLYPQEVDTNFADKRRSLRRGLRPRSLFCLFKTFSPYPKLDR
jgi:hypothetical protein